MTAGKDRHFLNKEVIIKAQELRIGNLVNQHFEDSEGEVTECNVRDIFDCLRAEHESDFKFSYTGIPLTSEWLERFGFKQFVHDSELQGKIVEYNYDNNLLTIVDWSAEGKKFTLSNSFSFKLRVDVNYVHQLQNLIFALTGSELQLKDKTV